MELLERLKVFDHKSKYWTKLNHPTALDISKVSPSDGHKASPEPWQNWKEFLGPFAVSNC